MQNLVHIQCSSCKSSIQFDAQQLTPNKPLVRCPICKQINSVSPEQLTPVPKKVEQPPIYPPKQTIHTNPQTNSEEVGWLVVHDEHTQQQIFALKKGKNSIGRFSESKPNDIAIVTQDRYMSRNHCIIEIKNSANGQLQYTIYDIGSTNGTFINANKQSKLKPDTILVIKDNDVIQIGRTKVILKTTQKHKTAQEASKTTLQSDYAATIIE